MAPASTRKNGRLYGYYLCTHASKHSYDSCQNPSLPAGEVERAVVGELRAVFGSPEMLARTFRAVHDQHGAEVDRFQREKAELRDRIRILNEMAERALQVGDGSAVLQRVNGDLADVEARLARVSDELAAYEASALAESDVTRAFGRLEAIWDELFPAEQERIVQLLVEKVEVGPEGLEVRLRADGLRSLVTDVKEGGPRVVRRLRRHRREQRRTASELASQNDAAYAMQTTIALTLSRVPSKSGPRPTPKPQTSNRALAANRPRLHATLGRTLPAAPGAVCRDLTASGRSSTATSTGACGACRPAPARGGHGVRGRDGHARGRASRRSCRAPGVS